jgi:hypothetical protein
MDAERHVFQHDGGAVMTRAWWQYLDDSSVAVPGMQVDDVRFVQPCGFVWFYKPRYRVKCERRVV